MQDTAAVAATRLKKVWGRRCWNRMAFLVTPFARIFDSFVTGKLIGNIYRYQFPFFHPQSVCHRIVTFEFSRCGWALRLFSDDQPHRFFEGVKETENAEKISPP